MKKYILAVMFALVACGQANASFIQGVTGADMAGIEVTVFYYGGESETSIWEATSDTAGGAIGATTGWSISLDGDSFGTSTPDGVSGAFEFFTGTVPDGSGFDYYITGFEIAMLSAGFVFDPTEGEGTDGSGAGRPFVLDVDPEAELYSVTYSDEFMTDLYGTLTLTLLEGYAFLPDNTAFFVTDTDAIADVPAPAGLALIALALVGIRASRRK